jgi:hypothetical protein
MEIPATFVDKTGSPIKRRIFSQNGPKFFKGPNRR